MISEADRVQRAHRGLAAGARAFDADLEVLHAVLLRRVAGLLGGDLRGERRALARALEAAIAGGRPRQRVALPIRDVMIVLLNDAWMWATASRICRLAFLRTLAAAAAARRAAAAGVPVLPVCWH